MSGTAKQWKATLMVVLAGASINWQFGETLIRQQSMVGEAADNKRSIRAMHRCSNCMNDVIQNILSISNNSTVI